MRILVTGFEPFGGDGINASGEAMGLLVTRFDDPTVDLVAALLPVSFTRAPQVLRALIERHRPDAVVAVGEAGGRAAVTPELVAVNDQVARIPDNDGARPEGPIDEGPWRLPTRLDAPALVAAVKALGLPAELSEDAGRFVCNAVFRTALTAFDGPAGFVHVPAVRYVGVAEVGAETDDAAPRDSGMTMDEVADALAAVVTAVARSDRM